MITIRKRAIRVGAATTIAAAAMLASAMAAFAHPAPFTVTAGAAAPGTSVPVTGTAGAIAIKDTTTGITLTCNPVTVHGALSVGSGLGAGSIVEIDGTASTWSCPSFGGLHFLIAGYGTWHLNVDDVTGGVATGTISNIRAHMSTTGGSPYCVFDIGAYSGSFTSSGTATIDPGTVDTTFANATQKLGLLGTSALNSGTLGFWNVKSGTGGVNTYCVSPAIWKQGDQISITAQFTLTADALANNPIAIN